MINGILWLDLPPKPKTSELRLNERRRRSLERELIERMAPRMRDLMEDGDLFEAKADAGRQAVAAGVGQLKLGAFEKGQPGELFLVLPTRPSDVRARWIEDEGIILVTEADDGTE
jgi:hypothetical protein